MDVCSKCLGTGRLVPEIDRQNRNKVYLTDYPYCECPKGQEEREADMADDESYYDQMES